MKKTISWLFAFVITLTGMFAGAKQPQIETVAMDQVAQKCSTPLLCCADC